MGALCFAFLLTIQLSLPFCTSTSSSPSESPAFAVVHLQQERQFEIRRYDSALWVGAPAVEDISFVRATEFGAQELSDWWPTFLPSTEPLITGIRPSDGPFCATTFSVRLYLPGSSEPVVKPPQGFQLEWWQKQCVAVRTFEGPARDATVAQEAAHLADSLRGTPWANIVDKELVTGGDEYIIAQYSTASLGSSSSHSEVWMLIDTKRDDCHPPDLADSTT